jgi:hypothetical protein
LHGTVWALHGAVLGVFWRVGPCFSALFRSFWTGTQFLGWRHVRHFLARVSFVVSVSLWILKQSCFHRPLLSITVLHLFHFLSLLLAFHAPQVMAINGSDLNVRLEDDDNSIFIPYLSLFCCFLQVPLFLVSCFLFYRNLFELAIR